MTISQWAHVTPATPGTTISSPSQAYVADTLYVVFVTQFNSNSVEPSTPSVSGMGTTWTDITPANAYWDSSAPSLRKTHVFRGRPSAGGTGVVSATVAAAPETADMVIVGSSDSDTVVQVKGSPHTANTGVMTEALTMTTPGSTDNRWIAYVATNIQAAASARFELDADTNGDADWTSFAAVQHSSAPVGTFLAGYLDANPTTDVTPGWLQTSGNNGTSYIVCVEVNKTAAPPPPSSGGRWAAVWGFTGTTSPPPTPSEFLIGAAVAQRNGLTYAGATAQFVTDLSNALGAPCTLPHGRRYWGNSPVGQTFASIPQFVQDRNVRHRFISWKGEATLAECQDFMETIPDDGFITRVTQHHEPENDGGAHTPTWFRGMMANLHGAWVAMGRPDYIIPCVNLMSWLERDNNAATSSALWFPDSSIIADFELWIDPYDAANNRTLQQQSQPTYELWVSEGGDPTKFGVIETGSHRTGANLATWIHNGIAWLRSLDAKGWTWFHSPVGPEGPWWLDDIDGRRAMAEEIVA